MERRMILFLLILLINLLIVMIYLLWNMIVQKEKNRREIFRDLIYMEYMI